MVVSVQDGYIKRLLEKLRERAQQEAAGAAAEAEALAALEAERTEQERQVHPHRRSHNTIQARTQNRAISQSCMV